MPNHHGHNHHGKVLTRTQSLGPARGNQESPPALNALQETGITMTTRSQLVQRAHRAIEWDEVFLSDVAVGRGRTAKIAKAAWW